MGVGLHSRNTGVEIVNYIAKDIKREIFGKIVEENLKLYMIIDEASTISSKSVLVIFIKVEGDEYSPTIFLDLIQLEGQDRIRNFVEKLE